MIVAVVLAAGRSARMGRPKPLLVLDDGRCFLQAILDTARSGGAGDVRVVLGHDAEAIVREALLDPRLAVENPDPASGMLSSVRAGVRALPPACSGFLLWPVDQPLVRAATVQKLIATFEEGRPPLVVPVHTGRRGHPTLFDARLADEVVAAPDDVGARAVVHRHEGDLREVEVDDPGVVTDIDTPEAYARAVGRRLP